MLAIQSLKVGKSAGVDEIRPEMLKAMGKEGVLWLSRVIKVAWESGETPGELLQLQGHISFKSPRESLR
jgi:hypothetical protein